MIKAIVKYKDGTTRELLCDSYQTLWFSLDCEKVEQVDTKEVQDDGQDDA